LDFFHITAPTEALLPTVTLTSSTDFTALSQGEVEIYLQVSQYEGLPERFIFPEANLGQRPKLVCGTPTWSKFSAQYNDFSVASTTKSFQICPVLGDEIVHAIVLKHSKAFAGVSTLVATVGYGELAPYSPVGFTASNPTAYIGTPFDLMQSVADSAKDSYSTMIFDLFDSTSRSLMLTLTSTGGNLSAMTLGVVDIYVLKSKLASK
jgi:hypothetical protein